MLNAARGFSDYGTSSFFRHSSESCRARVGKCHAAHIAVGLCRRRDEIIDTCEALYQAESYNDITMAQIADGVPYGRANIYNYFQNKDEALLALMQREHDRWSDDLDELAMRAAGLSRDGLADVLAFTLKKRVQMLKLLNMNLYDMEESVIVCRKIFAEEPPRVECSLTELGPTLQPVLDAMWMWGEGDKAALRKCRL